MSSTQRTKEEFLRFIREATEAKPILKCNLMELFNKSDKTVLFALAKGRKKK